jgi:hypothetical protein
LSSQFFATLAFLTFSLINRIGARIRFLGYVNVYKYKFGFIEFEDKSIHTELPFVVVPANSTKQTTPSENIVDPRSLAPGSLSKNNVLVSANVYIQTREKGKVAIWESTGSCILLFLQWGWVGGSDISLQWGVQIMVEPGEQCTVVFALTVTEPTLSVSVWRG